MYLIKRANMIIFNSCSVELASISFWAFLLSTLQPAGTVHRGMDVVLTSAGLNFLETDILKTVNINAKRYRFDLKNTSSSSGRYNIKFTDLYLSRLAVDRVELDVQPGLLVDIWFRNVSLTVIGKWQTMTKGWNQVRDRGWLRGHLENGTFSVLLDMMDLISVNSSDCQSFLLQIKMESLGNQVLPLSFISTHATDSVKTALCNHFRNQISDYTKNNQLDNIVYYIQNYLLLDYRLIDEPKVIAYEEDAKDKDILFSVKGFFHWYNESTFPFVPKSLPRFRVPTWFNSTQPMVVYVISEYLPNTLLFTAFQHKLLQYYVRSKDVPEKFRGTMKPLCGGYCLEDILEVSDLERHAESEMEIFLQTKNPPKFQLKNGKATVDWSGSLSFYSRFPSNISEYLFTFSCDVTYEVGIWMKRWDLRLNFEILDINSLSLDRTFVGPISDSSMDRLLRGVNRIFMEPKMDEIGHMGLPLPLPTSMELRNVQVHRLEHALAIWGNIARSSLLY